MSRYLATMDDEQVIVNASDDIEAIIKVLKAFDIEISKIPEKEV